MNYAFPTETSLAQMNKIETPTPDNFFACAIDSFAFLSANPDVFESPTLLKATFTAPKISVSLCYDRRDQQTRCHLIELRDADTDKAIELPACCNLFGYLVRHKGYRGSLREFVDSDSDPTG